MQVVSNSEEMIFRKDFNDKPIYSMGLSKKDKNGNYVNGYIGVNFKKGTDIKDKTKIKIKDAWLSFYKKDKATIPTIFINDYELVSESSEEIVSENSVKTESNFEQVEITDDDLPF